MISLWIELISMSRPMKKYYCRAQNGFTLIELLIVTSVVGILAAISIPHYNHYRMNAFDRRAQLDLRDTATAEEAYYSENFVYKACDQTTCPTLLPGLGVLSAGVILNITTEFNTFSGTATHPKGSGVVFTWP